MKRPQSGSSRSGFVASNTNYLLDTLYDKYMRHFVAFTRKSSRNWEEYDNTFLGEKWKIPAGNTNEGYSTVSTSIP